ncbi:hypothetical protein FACS189434_03810 [Bacteroidia bacterium]|nr:hypothetical protein FACS189434_03810 [Bacteroidia bacterium]
MKQKMFFSIVVAFFVACSGGLKEQKILGVNGSPKSIKEINYEATEKFGEVIEQDIEDVLYYEFDKQGLVQKMGL